jgi:hypothetical protein
MANTVVGRNTQKTCENVNPLGTPSHGTEFGSTIPSASVPFTNNPSNQKEASSMTTTTTTTTSSTVPPGSKLIQVGSRLPSSTVTPLHPLIPTKEKNTINQQQQPQSFPNPNPQHAQHYQRTFQQPQPQATTKVASVAEQRLDNLFKNTNLKKQHLPPPLDIKGTTNNNNNTPSGNEEEGDEERDEVENPNTNNKVGHPDGYESSGDEEQEKNEDDADEEEEEGDKVDEQMAMLQSII